MVDNHDLIREALDHAAVLHAIILGKRAARDQVSSDVDAQLKKAEVAFNKTVREAQKRLQVATEGAHTKLDKAKEGQAGRVHEATSVVQTAERELAQHEKKAMEDLGIGIALENAKPTGGRTNL